jgi:hypothetical protein
VPTFSIPRPQVSQIEIFGLKIYHVFGNPASKYILVADAAETRVTRCVFEKSRPKGSPTRILSKLLGFTTVLWKK